MSPRWTKDEMFVSSAYEATLQLENPDAELNKYEIGERIGISAKAVDTICNLLAQANFIKKVSKTEIRLTSNGRELAERLRREH